MSHEQIRYVLLFFLTLIGKLQDLQIKIDNQKTCVTMRWDSVLKYINNYRFNNEPQLWELMWSLKEQDNFKFYLVQPFASQLWFWNPKCQSTWFTNANRVRQFPIRSNLWSLEVLTMWSHSLIMPTPLNPLSQLQRNISSNEAHVSMCREYAAYWQVACGKL
jgi:hypothetical protein